MAGRIIRHPRLTRMPLQSWLLKCIDSLITDTEGGIRADPAEFCPDGILRVAAARRLLINETGTEPITFDPITRYWVIRGEDAEGGYSLGEYRDVVAENFTKYVAMYKKLKENGFPWPSAN